MKHRSPTDYPTLAIAVVVGTLELALFSSAAEADGAPPLPPEAYAACDSKSAGEACSVSIHGRDLAGTCAAGPDDPRLFCRLTAPPPRPPGTRRPGVPVSR
jgi:hypothetical protein